MAKPNVACPKCHGTGWEDKSGTSRRRPCPNCSKGQLRWEQLDPARVLPFREWRFVDAMHVEDIPKE